MRRQVRLGMTLFLLADAVFFFFLILAFVYFRDASLLRTAVLSLDLRATAAWTACLAASSFSLWRAVSGRRARFWLGATLALGAAFFIGQGREYLRILHSGIATGKGLFATTFFTLAGIYDLHLSIGILLLAILLVVADSTDGYATAAGAIALYWNFIAAVWIVMFSVVYLWTFL